MCVRAHVCVCFFVCVFVYVTRTYTHILTRTHTLTRTQAAARTSEQARVRAAVEEASQAMKRECGMVMSQLATTRNEMISEGADMYAQVPLCVKWPVEKYITSIVVKTNNNIDAITCDVIILKSDMRL